MEPREQGVDALLNDGLEIPHALGREEGVDGGPAYLVEVVIDGANATTYIAAVRLI